MPAPYPIVLLPGVMGSRLFFPHTRRYWDPDSSRHMLRWVAVPLVNPAAELRAQLHARSRAGVVVSQSTDVANEAEQARGWGGIVWSFYGQFLRDLQGTFAPAPVYAVGYDWRQDIRWLGGYLRDRLDEILADAGAEKAIIVTHSMGGLIARSAFAQFPAVKQKVRGVAYVCQPCVGAPVLYRRLFTGLVRDLDGGGGISDRVFRLILGNSREEFLANMSGLPGPLQLVPSEHYPKDGAGKAWHSLLTAATTFGDFYPNAQSPPGIVAATGLEAAVVADLRDRVVEVGEFHAVLKAPADASVGHPESWSIYGKDVKTEIGVDFAGEAPTPRQSADGDGVVPVPSATALALADGRMVAVSGATHADACLNADVRRFVRGAIEQMYTADGVTTGLSFAVAGVAPSAELESRMESFGIGDWLRGTPQPWQYSGHVFGYMAPAADGQAPVLQDASAIKADPTLKNAKVKITLDRLRVASYPGGGTHRVLFDFAARNQTDAGAEPVHFNSTYRAREGSQAAVVGYPIFVGLNVGPEGVAFRCTTVNVKNDEDEAFLNLLETDTFTSGLKFLTTAQPALGPLSALAVGLAKSIASRNRNVPVQEFHLGLDFSDIPLRARLAVGSYVAVQVPDDEQAAWDWSQWSISPAGQIVRRGTKAEPLPYNYLVFGVSRFEGA